LKVPRERLKQRYLDLNKVAFCDGQEAENELKMTREHLKHRFFDFTHVAFWACQEEEIEFPVPGDHLNIAYLTPPKSNFGLFKKQKMTFKCHSTT